MADEQPVDATEDHPGWTCTRAPPSPTRTRLKCRRQSTSTESVCDWPLSEVPPARNTSGVPRRPRAREQPDDVADVTWGDDRLRDQPVRARVGGVPDQVGRAGVDLLLAERGASCALRLAGVPLGDPVGARSGAGLADYSSHIPDATRA